MAGKVGRPKNGEKNEVVREILSEKMFSDLNGSRVYVTVTRPFIFQATEENEKSELRFQLKIEKVGSSGKESFDVPVSAIPILRHSFTSVIARERNKFLAETDRSSQAVRLRLSRFSDRGMGGYHGILLVGIPVNVVSKDPDQQDPVNWLDRVFSDILEEVGETTVISSEPRSETKSAGSASLDEINATVSKTHPTLANLIQEKLAEKAQSASPN